MINLTSYFNKLKSTTIPKKWMILFLVNLGCVLIALGLSIAFNLNGKILGSQYIAKKWSGESQQRFAQVSVFLPETNSFDTDQIYAFRQKIIDSTSDIVDDDVNNIYTDCWSKMGKVSVTGDHGSADASVIAVGGNYFYFHELNLLSGSYFSETDIMKDRVVLDEELAWKLFGGSNLVGMTVKLNGIPFVVSGVISRETDYADKIAYSSNEGLYMSFSAYSSLINNSTEEEPKVNTANSTAITCYEVVLPEPVTGYAYNLVNTEINTDDSNIVLENTSRFSKRSVFNNVIKQSNERIMQTKNIAFPYWENAARIIENRCAQLFIIEMIIMICPIISLLYMLIVLYKTVKRKMKEKFKELKYKYEERTLFRGMKGNNQDV